jgi:putative colanic acid biosynthesis UDP-glucose lipid carrier transferase
VNHAVPYKSVPAARTLSEVTPWDSSLAFVVKSLLYPMAVLVSLGLSLFLCNEPFRKPYVLTGVLAFLASADFLSVSPLRYSSGQGASPRGLLTITLRWLLVVSFLWALMSVSGLLKLFSSQVWLTWAALTPPVLWASGLAAHRAFGLNAIARRVRPSNAIIVGCNDLGRLLERRLQEDTASRIRVVGYCDDAQHHATPGSLLGDTQDLRRLIRANDVRVVYITWPMTRERRIFELLEVLRDSMVSIYFVPDVSIVNVIHGRVALVNGMPVVGVCESPLYGLRELQKRALDICVSSVAIVLGAPVFLAVAIGVRLSSPGPILFKQRRYGLDGREFNVYKFRSMTVTEDGRGAFSAATRNDRRITRFGAFIRRTSLDEIPQLFNVLSGSMSLVGPRPHVVAMNEAYRRVISGYMVRHRVRPGITGWAQVNGQRGGDDLDSMRRRLQFDLEYLKKWSLWLDLVILARTAALVWSDRHAY